MKLFRASARRVSLLPHQPDKLRQRARCVHRRLGNMQYALLASIFHFDGELTNVAHLRISGEFDCLAASKNTGAIGEGLQGFGDFLRELIEIKHHPAGQPRGVKDTGTRHRHRNSHFVLGGKDRHISLHRQSAMLRFGKAERRFRMSRSPLPRPKPRRRPWRPSSSAVLVRGRWSRWQIARNWYPR